MSIVAAVATEVDRRRPRPLQRRRSDAKCFGQSTSETDAKAQKFFFARMQRAERNLSTQSQRAKYRVSHHIGDL